MFTQLNFRFVHFFSAVFPEVSLKTSPFALASAPFGVRAQRSGLFCYNKSAHDAKRSSSLTSYFCIFAMKDVNERCFFFAYMSIH